MTAYHVAPYRMQWSVRKAGAARVGKVVLTRDDAVAYAVARADRVYVHGTDGRITDRIVAKEGE